MASDVSPRSTRWLPKFVTGVPFLVTAAVVAILVLAYTLAGFFLVPRLIATYVPRYVQEQLNRRAEIGKVRVNPLLFKLEIKHFRLQEADGKPLLGFDRLFVDFELSSLFRWAWTFAEIRLDAPRLDVVLDRDGRLNVAELLDAFSKGREAPRQEATAPPRVLLQHAVLRHGSMSFTDHSARTNPQAAALEPIDIELRDITTLPERRGPYAIAATLRDGGVVGWEGEVSLVPLSSSGRLGIRGFPLATAWRFVQEDFTLTEPAGRVDSEVRYQFDYRDGVTSLKVEDLGVTVAGLVLTQRGEKAPILTLETIRLAGGRGDVIARDLTVSEITVGPGRLAVTTARDGTMNWQNLVVAKPEEAPAPPAPTKEERPWRLAVDKVRVEQVALAVADYSRVTPLGVDVAGLSLALSARLESASAGLGGVIDGLGVTLARVAWREAATANTPVVALDQIVLEGGRIDLAGHHVALSRIGVTGGVSTLVVDPDGSMQLERMVKVRETGTSLPLARKLGPAPAPARPAPAAKPWTVSLEKLELAGHRVAFSDRSVTPAVRVDLDEIKASVRDVRNDGKKPFPFDASLRMVQGGRFAIAGQVAPDGRAGEARLTATRLALPPAQPYVASVAAVELRSGDVSTAGRFTYRAGRDRPTITFTGSADIDRLVVVEATTGEPVVSWKSLHAETVRFGLTPDRLQINELRLAELDTRLVVAADKSFNVASLVKRDSPSASPPATAGDARKPKAQRAAKEDDPASAFPVSIERLRLDRGSMYFADLSLALPFGTRVHELNGVVAGLGSDPASRATLQFDGQVDEFGMFNVDGALSTFHPKVFTDIKVNFRNVPMPTLSPYSATFAGRRIRSGTMDLDLQYKINQSALEGENRVILQEVQLGERVEGPGVTRLPLDLAIAILSDADGKIDLELPVRGNVDRPEFSYGHLIWQALTTVITKAVTSPFRALASLFGDENAERLQTVVFEAGSDTIAPPEQEKLKRVAEVLGKRPRLKLTVNGGYEPKVDGEALRSLHVRQDLAQRLDVKVPPGQDPGPVAFDQARPQRALEALLTERGGPKALEEFQAGYEKKTGKKAERANPLLAWAGRGSSDRAFYEAMFRQLVETAPLADAEVTALGQRRGEAIARVLKERAGPAAERVEVGSPEAAGNAEKNAVPARLSLGVVGSS